MKTNYKILLNQFCHMDFSEDDAQKHWYGILFHQKQLEEALERPVGFTVALTDYLMNHQKVEKNLVLIEKENFKKTQDFANKDALTGLYNRRFLVDYLNKEFDKIERYPFVFSLIFLDIDHFKRLNDKYGHLFADHILVKAAEMLNLHSRKADLVVRYGGEEFIVILPQTSEKKAYEVADRIREKVQMREFKVPGCKDSIHITFSAGVATCPSDASTLDELLKKADEAMYRAKTLGRNRVSCCSELLEKPFRCANY